MTFLKIAFTVTCDISMPCVKVVMLLKLIDDQQIILIKFSYSVFFWITFWKFKWKKLFICKNICIQIHFSAQFAPPFFYFSFYHVWWSCYTDLWVIGSLENTSMMPSSESSLKVFWMTGNESSISFKWSLMSCCHVRLAPESAFSPFWTHPLWDVSLSLSTVDTHSQLGAG